MIEYLGITANKLSSMTTGWWNFIIIGLLIVTTVFGTCYVLFASYKGVKSHIVKKRNIASVPPAVAAYIDELKRFVKPLRQVREKASQNPKTFGAFLGGMSSPPTAHEGSLLSNWDMIVLDPRQAGVLDAATYQCTSAHILGRLDVRTLMGSDRSSNPAEINQCLGAISQALTNNFRRAGETDSKFTGVLLANWTNHFTPIICNRLIDYILALGFEVYLEISPPAFLNEEQVQELNMSLVRGVVCYNGTILPDGERRNYFEMVPMMPALRAMAGQAVIRDACIMMLEALDDNAEVRHAVVKRSYDWCRFKSAISWIGPNSALTNAEIAYRKTVVGEPMGAMMWLKEDINQKLHETWRLNDTISQHPTSDHSIYDTLEAFVPGLKSRLSVVLPDNNTERLTNIVDDFNWTSRISQEQNNPFLVSRQGHDFSELGCFPIGIEITPRDFATLVQGQRHLAKLNMLDPIKPEKLRAHVAKIQALYDARNTLGLSPVVCEAVVELLELCTLSDEEINEHLRIYIGLDSGFRTAMDKKFWGLYEADADTGLTDIYISAMAPDVPGTMLHTFLSSRGVSRVQSFLAEMALAHVQGKLDERWQMSPRMVHDLGWITPAENLLFMQRLTVSPCASCPECSALSTRVRGYAEYQLLEVPTITQLRRQNANTYLRGLITVEELIKNRLDWYREKGCYHPEFNTAVALFKEIDARLPFILLEQHRDIATQIDNVMQEVLQKGKIDASADIFGLALFCAYRKMALQEVIMEVTDRNPLPNGQPDQAACFAEMFSLGSNCEAYFDISPNTMGQILNVKMRGYYKKHQPPQRDDLTTELPTAYSSSNIDLDPKAGGPELPMYYRVSFLGIFAVPALVDILLLTTIGRGLYLSAFMTEVEKSTATSALMTSLFLTGAIGTWISSGGSYYLHSMAFSAMNMFVMTRFVAGVALAFLIGGTAFIVLAATKGVLAGVIFFLYFCMLTMYLTILAALAIYQLPDFMFQSGRVVITMCIPLLFISPILTLWVGHDIIVYLCILASFLTALLVGTRKVVAQWGTWYISIKTMTDKEVVIWYKDARILDPTIPGPEDDSVDVGNTAFPRLALHSAIVKEVNKSFWTKPTTDVKIKEMAEAYPATQFLLGWYTQYSRTKMPYAFSPTWNLQCKAAIDTLRDMQKGLKLHNAFIHWRHSGDEVWCGVLYFVIALLDKWISLLSGGSIVGLSAANSEVYRLAVGFGLSYFLIGAVFLDSVAQPLWATANKALPQPVNSIERLKQVAINDAKNKRNLYWRELSRYFFMHVWGLSITAALMWSFNQYREAVIMYLAYVGAYSGLLWYQYNRIFTGPTALKDLLTATCIALPTGVLLRHFLPNFEYGAVVGLGIGTWTAAILSVFTSKIGAPVFRKDSYVQETPIYHCCGTPGTRTLMSQAALGQIFDSTTTLPTDLRYRLDPANHPGVEVLDNLLSHNSQSSKNVVEAFRSAMQHVHKTADLWKRGETLVDLVPTRHLIDQEQKMRAISRLSDNKLHVYVFVGLDLVNDEWIMDIRRNCKVIAEAIIHCTAQARLGFTKEHSQLIELLAMSGIQDDEFAIPEGVKRQLEHSSNERLRVLKDSDKTFLRDLLLGLDVEVGWDNLPLTVRSYLIQRCCGLPCRLSDVQIDWMNSRLEETRCIDADELIARSNLGAVTSAQITAFASNLEGDHDGDRPEPPDSIYDDVTLLPNAMEPDTRIIDRILKPVFWSNNKLQIGIKFCVVALIADPEFQRELDYVMQGKPAIIRWPITFGLNILWHYVKTLQNIILPIFLLHGREKVQKVYDDMKGMKTVIMKNRIAVENIDGPTTCFQSSQADGTYQLHQYKGHFDAKPPGIENMMAVNTYSSKLVLLKREEWAKCKLVNTYEYEYTGNDPNRYHKLPIQRRCVEGDLKRQIVEYDNRGYIERGSYFKDDNLVEFKFWYRKNAKFDDELLRGEFSLPHISMDVAWSVPPANNSKRLDKWIPYTKVTEATFVQGSDVYHSKWLYDHKFHPVVTTTLNGQEIPTPPMIEFDWFGVLKKPKNCSFIADNPVFSFSSLSSNVFSRALGFSKHVYPMSTTRARSHLWKTWKNGKELDAVTTRWLDEMALRREKVMTPYWRARDWGFLRRAEDYILEQADTIMARVDLDPDISSWTHIAYKISDFLSMGQGGDSRINTRTVETQMQDSDTSLHVLAMDTGTWPIEGGGVSACRRDMVNNLDSIKWHVLAEAANDYGVPKFQMEKNVQSLTLLPLWGLDFLTPTHGVFNNCLDSEIAHRENETRDADIIKKFIPILTTLVRCSRAVKLSREHIVEATKALCDLNTYFESNRHWSDVWKSDIVKKVWRELWLSPSTDNMVPISDWLDAECPTLAHMDNALDMWHRYLFIQSVPVPEEIPSVFQASHHFAGASYGVVCKVKRGCSLHVWDHCISWREVTVFLSSAMSFDAPFVCTALISLSRVIAVLLLHHADVVLPCADFFNPGWEVELGSQENVICHRRTYRRKIDPVVNGITDMERFKPIEQIKSKRPTAVMLSHVRFVKDIKNAILAADLICNVWGFKDYRLEIYGDMERAPSYAVECQEIIAIKGLHDNVLLKGLGSPMKVLEDAWLFLNSSVSEGLPLAMGEAALTGVPVVCTDVGASFRVVTDPETGKRFSAVVAPNDSFSLARAQVNILAMLDEWSEYADDEPGYRPKLSVHPTADEVERFTKRMYEKEEQRRRLGNMGRTNVFNSFSSDRYLREHEQMLWIAKMQSGDFKANVGSSLPVSSRSSWLEKDD
ncbi:glycosyl transferase [Microthyrium microscopicum]|uniref:Glycosyl transferase n=1 Tax=Microthyrium microscopicum TaxID=703497 RepID=A0A6A6U6V1_9PEZI|nr:glycosyl transferase [Microthyrium microscopicum]